MTRDESSIPPRSTGEKERKLNEEIEVVSPRKGHGLLKRRRRRKREKMLE